MSIEAQVLGGAERDNALYVRINTGQTRYRLLLDCGEGCAAELPVTELLQIDHVFSYLHMDHIAGFDTLFRATWNRSVLHVVWGPPETARLSTMIF